MRCTLLLMLDYQVGFTPCLHATHTTDPTVFLLTFSRSILLRTLTSVPLSPTSISLSW